MGLHVVWRRYDRPDTPQPVYTGALDLWEAYKYVPIGTATREGSYRTPDRRSDRTYVLQTSPAFSWVASAADAVIATWQPVFAAELRGARTADRPKLDVRFYEWSPQPAWIVSGIPPAVTTAQLWPAFQPQGYRTAERARLDVRSYEWAPEFTWAARVVDGIVAKWVPAFDARAGYRTPDRSRLDVRQGTDRPALAWLYPILPSAPVTTAALLTVADATVTRLVLGDAAMTDLTVADNPFTILTVDDRVAGS